MLSILRCRQFFIGRMTIIKLSGGATSERKIVTTDYGRMHLISNVLIVGFFPHESKLVGY